jgi:hypothetical protein
MQVVKWIQRQHFLRPGDGAEFFACRVLRMPSSSHADWSGRDSRIDHAVCRYMRRLTRFTVAGPVPVITGWMHVVSPEVKASRQRKHERSSGT